MAQEAPPLVYTIPEVAERLGVSDWMIRKLVADGKLGHVRVGHLIRIPADTLAQFVAGSKCPTLNASAPRGKSKVSIPK
jgi:excisionase family DNA binding protein